MNVFILVCLVLLFIGVLSKVFGRSRISELLGIALVAFWLFYIFIVFGLFEFFSIQIPHILLGNVQFSIATMFSFVLLGIVLLSSNSSFLKKLRVVELASATTLVLALLSLFGVLFKDSNLLTYSLFLSTEPISPIFFALFGVVMFVIFRPKYSNAISLKNEIIIFLIFFTLVLATVWSAGVVEKSIQNPNFNQTQFFKLFPAVTIGIGVIISSLALLIMRIFITMRTEAVKYANEVTKGLRQAKAKDEAMLESIGEGLVATGKDGNIVLVNRAFEYLLGWKEEEVQGKLFTHIVPMLNEVGTKITDGERPIQRILKKESTAMGAYSTSNSYYKSKNGKLFPVAITISPILVEGEIIGAVEVFRDITKEKEIDKEKTEFVSLASHQLRTPLSTINWYTEMLLSGDVGKLSENQEKYLKEIYAGSQRMVELVNSLLNVSRLELGTFAIEPELTSLPELAQAVIKEQTPQLESKKIYIETNFGTNVPDINVDPKLLRMVFQNLLSNAIKYTSTEGHVLVSIESKGNEILIKVSDSGWGIPKDEQNKVFSKLFRASNVKEQDTEGTGLGLYIVKSVVEQSGGSIQFESEEHKGTTFFVTLPIEGMKKKEGTRKLS